MAMAVIIRVTSAGSLSWSTKVSFYPIEYRKEGIFTAETPSAVWAFYPKWEKLHQKTSPFWWGFFDTNSS
jgi:hypothetical protein